MSKFLERSRSSSLEKLNSPKGRHLAHFIETELAEQETENSVEVFDGNVADVKYIGKTGQTKWDMDNLEFYVLIPDVSLTMFCLDNRVRQIPMNELREILLQKLDGTSFVAPTLFYKGDPVDLEKEVQAYPDKAAFILAPQNLDLKHSGKLFSCACTDCFVGESMPGWQLFRGHSNHAKNSKCKCDHPIYMRSQLEGKKAWGKNHVKNH